MKKRVRLGDSVSNVTDLKHRAKKFCGSHFFDPATMRFFKSKVHGPVYPNHVNNYTCFVTSEQGPGGPRAYTVKKFSNCEIDTVGKFQQYGTLKAAKTAARACARK